MESDPGTKLPPLPEPRISDYYGTGYTADQMHAYANAAIAKIAQPTDDQITELARTYGYPISLCGDQLMRFVRECLKLRGPA